MIRRFWIALILVSACVRLLPSAPAEVAGIRYEHRSLAGPLSVHILDVDPRLLRIESVRALDDGVGRETVSSIALRTGAVAAVNAGFFRIGGRYDGEPDGILKIRERWFSDPAVARGAIGWTRDGTVARIGRLLMKWDLRSRGRTFPIDGINRPRGIGEAVLYNWAFHRSTLTDPGGIEFLISRNRIAGVVHGGNSGIPPGGYVLSVGPKSALPLDGLKARAQAKIEYELREEDALAGQAKTDWRTMDYIVGGVPTLIRKGRVVVAPNAERMRAGFDTERHPRTAVGLRPDGRWILVVVDGRQPELSIGMDLRELADLLLSLGCVDALNLDGGGSSTLFYERAVVNSPSDATKERPVSDAVVILRR